MDFSLVNTQLLSPLNYLLIIIVMTCLFRLSWFKTGINEYKFRLLMRWRLPSKDYCILNNITLDNEASSVHIGHIIVSKFGLFIIETQNRQGWILGKQEQKYWTQRVYKHTCQFQNPLPQTRMRAIVLKTQFGISTKRIFPIIVFIGDSHFKTPMPDNVTTAKDCMSHIRSKVDILFTEQEVNRMVTALKQQPLSARQASQRAAK